MMLTSSYPYRSPRHSIESTQSSSVPLFNCDCILSSPLVVFLSGHPVRPIFLSASGTEDLDPRKVLCGEEYQRLTKYFVTQGILYVCIIPQATLFCKVLCVQMSGNFGQVYCAHNTKTGGFVKFGHLSPAFGRVPTAENAAVIFACASKTFLSKFL